MKAFTVKPLWAYLIVHGVKDCENRNIAPKPGKGTAAIHVSKTFTHREYDEVMSNFPPHKREQMPYETLASICGKIIGIVDYSVEETTESPWWDRSGKPIMLSNPRWVKVPFIPCKGALQFWTLPEDIEKQVMSSIE